MLSLNFLAIVYCMRGKANASLACAEALAKLAEVLPEVFQRTAVGAVGVIEMICGESALGREKLERVLASESDDAVLPLNSTGVWIDPISAYLVGLAVALTLLGHVDEGVARLQRAGARARSLGHALSQATVDACSVLIHWLRRDEAGYLAALQALVRDATALGGFGPVIHMAGAQTIVDAIVSPGVESALELLREIEMREAHGQHFCMPFLRCIAAERLADAGQYPVAIAALDAAIVKIEGNGERFVESEIHRLRGELLWRSADAIAAPRRRKSEDRAQVLPAAALVAAEAALRRALDVARAQRVRISELGAAVALGRFLDAHGREGEARAELAELCAWFPAGTDFHDLQAARELLAGYG